MKRKVWDLRPWARALTCEQRVTLEPEWVLVDFRAGEVERPLDVPFHGESVRILGDHYRWVRAHPRSGEGRLGHAATVQLDEQGTSKQLYVDIHLGEGLTDGGLPWHDDLYLDVTAALEDDAWTVTRTELLDEDELQEALEAGKVTPEQARAAHAEAGRVRRALLNGTFAPLHRLRAYLGLAPTPTFPSRLPTA